MGESTLENRKQQLGISLIEVALSISIFSLTIIMVLKTFNFQQNQNDIIDTTVQKVQAVIAVANALQSGGYYPSEKTLDTYFSQRNININLNTTGAGTYLGYKANNTGIPYFRIQFCASKASPLGRLVGQYFYATEIQTPEAKQVCTQNGILDRFQYLVTLYSTQLLPHSIHTLFKTSSVYFSQPAPEPSSITSTAVCYKHGGKPSKCLKKYRIYNISLNDGSFRKPEVSIYDSGNESHHQGLRSDQIQRMKCPINSVLASMPLLNSAFFTNPSHMFQVNGSVGTNPTMQMIKTLTVLPEVTDQNALEVTLPYRGTVNQQANESGVFRFLASNINDKEDSFLNAYHNLLTQQSQRGILPDSDPLVDKWTYQFINHTSSKLPYFYDVPGFPVFSPEMRSALFHYGGIFNIYGDNYRFLTRRELTQYSNVTVNELGVVVLQWCVPDVFIHDSGGSQPVVGRLDCNQINRKGCGVY